MFYVKYSHIGCVTLFLVLRLEEICLGGLETDFHNERGLLRMLCVHVSFRYSCTLSKCSKKFPVNMSDDKIIMEVGRRRDGQQRLRGSNGIDLKSLLPINNGNLVLNKMIMQF